MGTNDALRDHFCRENAGITPPEDNTPLLTSGLLDSLAIVKLLTFIEEEFGVKIPDAEFSPDNFESITAISALIDSKKA